MTGNKMVSEFPIKIAKIGVKGVTKINKCFTFAKRTYYLNIDIDINQFLDDLKVVKQFQLDCVKSNDGGFELWLNLQSNLLDLPYHCANEAKRLIDLFFITSQENHFDENEDIDGNKENERSDNSQNKTMQKDFSLIVENLYQELQQSHQNDECFGSYTDQFVQHEYLRVTLKAYQIKAVKWMVHRERNIEYYMTEYKEIKCRWYNERSTRFFYNPINISLTTNPNVLQNQSLPSGGILADEMGLGKTIEILDLILINQSSLKPYLFHNSKEINKKLLNLNGNMIHCFCGSESVKHTVMCTKCLKLQHRKCVNQCNTKDDPDNSYICQFCWQNEEKLSVKTTLIVSPKSIKNQWKDEIANRIQHNTIKLLIFNGTKSCKWTNPYKLASYDIILTDYDTMRCEFSFTDLNLSTRKLRNTSSRNMKRKSPLMFLKFWRICLDESQMVSNIEAIHAQVISNLSAVHRWVVTGTPIQTSFDDIFGLIKFLNYSPYNESIRWHKTVDKLISESNMMPILSLLKRIMWRTCKSKNVLDELTLPKQTEVLHYIELSYLNRFHYNQQHKINEEDLKRALTYLDPTTKLNCLRSNQLENLLQPLRTLRRICSILQVSGENGRTIIMRPDELLEYLINEHQDSAQLRLKAIQSRIKTYISFVLGTNQKVEETRPVAMKFCTDVLEWAEDYENDPTMIDSFLQTQTLQRIALLEKHKKHKDRTNSDDKLAALEIKYWNRHFNLYIDSFTELEKHATKFRLFENTFTKDFCKFWNAAMNHKKLQLQLFEKIKTRMLQSYESLSKDFASIDDLVKMLNNWNGTLLRERKKLKEVYGNLNSIIPEPINGEQDKSSVFFLFLLNEASNCHLDLPHDEPMSPKRAKRLCQLCLIHKQLDRYGLLITDRAHKMIKRTIQNGNIPYPSIEESICHVIVRESQNVRIIEKDIIAVLKTLEDLRYEYHKYKNLLNSLEKCITKYVKVKENNPPKAISSLGDTRGFIADLLYAQTKYADSINTIRYLKSMQKDSNSVECEICQSATENRFGIFVCGHRCCLACCEQLANHSGGIHFKCPFCRRHLCKDEIRNVEFQGNVYESNSSCKIGKVLYEIHKLLSNDPYVKILIFSQWNDILATLERKLFEHMISTRKINGPTGVSKIVEEFKDPLLNINCLLIPYSYGSNGINLTEATHVFLVEPILNRNEELQAVGRVHRINQTRETFVHRFITKNTIEETIYKTMLSEKKDLLSTESSTVKNLMDFFVHTDIQSL